MNGDAFLAYVEQVLVPTLKPGDIVVMDNLPAHKVAAVRDAIEAPAPASLPAALFARLQPDREWPSPSSRPRCARPPSAPSKASGHAIGEVLDAFTPHECANYFAAAGYDPY